MSLIAQLKRRNVFRVGVAVVYFAVDKFVLEAEPEHAEALHRAFRG